MSTSLEPTDDFLERFAVALEARAGVALPSGVASEATREAVLDVASEVAHGTVRKNAPLATFLVGAYVTARQAQGADLATALSEAAAMAAELAAS